MKALKGKNGPLRLAIFASLLLAQAECAAETGASAHKTAVRVDSSANMMDMSVGARLKSGQDVKIRNRKSGMYLASCGHCEGVTQTMARLDGTCANLLAPTRGCMFTTSACLASTFQIIKHGFSMGSSIDTGDLVLLRSSPRLVGMQDFHAYMGTCGDAGGMTCADATATVRLYKGNDTNPSMLKAMPHETMWTISKTPASQGSISLGEYVTFTKASSSRAQSGAGSNLAVCNKAATAEPVLFCGARSNVFTTKHSEHTTPEELLFSHWHIEVDSTVSCVEPKDIAVVARTVKTTTTTTTTTTTKGLAVCNSEGWVPGYYFPKKRVKTENGGSTMEMEACVKESQKKACVLEGGVWSSTIAVSWKKVSGVLPGALGKCYCSAKPTARRRRKTLTEKKSSKWSRCMLTMN